MHKSITNICKGRKSNLFTCKNKSQILQVLLQVSEGETFEPDHLSKYSATRCQA